MANISPYKQERIPYQETIMFGLQPANKRGVLVRQFMLFGVQVYLLAI